MLKVTETCPVCKKDFINVSQHISMKKDKEHLEYLEKINKIIDKYLLETDFYMKEIVEIINNSGNFCTMSLIARRENEICPGRGYEIMGQRRTGNNNPVNKKEVREKISSTVTQKWKYGSYKNRTNGMLDKFGKLNPKFNVYKFLKWRYDKIYKFYHDQPHIFCNQKNCFKSSFDHKINIHHIDENKDNFLLTNLEAFCVHHHMDKHYGSRKTPFVRIMRKFTFDSSHNLLDYNGKCASIHGHTYHLNVSVKKRIDLQTGMVMDFGDLNSIVKNFIIERLDHKYLNNEIPEFNPTAENMIFWMWSILEKEAKLKGLHSIELFETPNSSALITQEDVLMSPSYIMTYYNEMVDYYNWEKK